MKPKIILAALTIFLAVGGFIKLSVDNAHLKRKISNLTHQQNDQSDIRTVSFSYREVIGPFDNNAQNQPLLILSSAESERLLKTLESEKGFRVSEFPQTSVPSGQEVTFELSDLTVRATPVVGADGFTIDLLTSVYLEGKKTPSLAKNTIWTGQTVVMSSPRNPNSLLFLQAHIQP